jgi:hypothetical protein
MSGPIYKLFIISGFTEAYYQLSAEENNRFWASVEENEAAVGANFLILCDTRWCNEGIAHYGVVEYSGLQAVQDVTLAHEKDQVFRYSQSESYLGTALEGFEPAQAGYPNPLYQMFQIKNVNNNVWESLPEEERERIFGLVKESIGRHGGVMIIGCDTNWSNEEYANFGVIAWPSVEAQQGHFQDLEKIGWHRYISARTILGTKHKD